VTEETPDEAFSRDPGDGIVFWGRDGDARVRCRVSREALDDHFSDGGKLRPEAAFKKHRKAIEALARRQYLRPARAGRRRPLADARHRVGSRGAGAA
jgi:hypothetical protein